MMTKEQMARKTRVLAEMAAERMANLEAGKSPSDAFAADETEHVNCYTPAEDAAVAEAPREESWVAQWRAESDITAEDMYGSRRSGR